MQSRSIFFLFRDEFRSSAKGSVPQPATKKVFARDGGMEGWLDVCNRISLTILYTYWTKRRNFVAHKQSISKARMWLASRRYRRESAEEEEKTATHNNVLPFSMPFYFHYTLSGFAPRHAVVFVHEEKSSQKIISTQKRMQVTRAFSITHIQTEYV